MDLPEATDSQLLSTWLERREESAFRALVKRHGRFVHSVARRTCQDDAQAADVSQLVFILLAQKAGALTSRTSVAGWLHLATVNQAQKMFAKSRREARKLHHFQTHMETPHAPDPAASWQEIRPQLDQALAALSESDRETLLLRFHRSMSVKEIAATLGLSANTAQKRLDRATERLREKLTRRGVTTAGSLSAVMLAGFSADAQAAVISTSVLSSKAIAASAVSSTFITPIALLIMTKKTTIAAVAVLLLAGGAVIAVKNPKVFSKNGSAEPRAETASSTTRENSRNGERTVDRERDIQKRESIQLAAQKRYEELLEENPDMRLNYRNVPDEENGYLQYLLLAERLDEQWLPENLRLTFEGKSDWDAQKFKAWLANNQDWFDSMLRIAELPDSSIRGIALNRQLETRFKSGAEFAFVLRSAARLEAEGGDMEKALRYFSAAVGLGDLLMNTEAPSLLEMSISNKIRKSSRDSFREDFLPVLSSQPEVLEAWGAAIFHDEDLAEDYARVIKGEWNVTMRHYILPRLLGDAAPGSPNFSKGDADAKIDSFTSEMRKLAEGFSQQGPDRFDVSQVNAWTPESVSDLKDPKGLSDYLTELQQRTQRLAIQHTLQAMHSAALSIQLGGKPELDPVSGKEFRWDSQNRVLTAPEGVSGIDEMKIP